MIIRLSQQDIECLHSVKALLDKNFKTRFTIRQLEYQFRINENKLRHGFKQLFHCSVSDYQEKLKLDCAIGLLKDRDKTIKEAAYRSGFKEITTFNRAFKKDYKMTPREWKKLNCTNGLVQLEQTKSKAAPKENSPSLNGSARKSRHTQVVL